MNARTPRILALGLFGLFILIAFIGPIFISKPKHLGAQITVRVVAYVLFATLAALQLAS